MTIFDELRKTRRRPAPHLSGKAILEVQGVSLRYPTGPALDEVSFHLDSGERVAVVGPNGAGKSTLFKIIAGLLEPEGGHVAISGHDPGGHICIAYLPQRSQVDWNFPVNVTDVVMMGRIGKLGLLRWPKKKDWDFVRRCLKDVGLQDLTKRQISELSGGQQQRMFIARALAQEAEIMLMDEPLNGLDVNSQETIYEILDDLQQRGVTVMIATHDLEQAAQRFDRVMLLNKRILGFGKPDQVFVPEQLVAAYGGSLHLIETPQHILALGDSCCEDGEH